MSDPNPYAPTRSTVEYDEAGIRAVEIRPLQLMKRGYDLIADEYWLFLAITFFGLTLASVTPLGLLTGPMMVGIFLCYAECEQGQRVDFTTLFRGFEYLVESVLAWLILLVAGMIVMIPLLAVIGIILWTWLTATAPGGNAPAARFPWELVAIYPLIGIANFAIMLPMLFVFPLIGDREVSSWQAVKMSCLGLVKNLLGVILFVFVLSFISILLTLMCYLPGVLFLPIMFGAVFVLYQDIYQPSEIGMQRSPRDSSLTEGL